MLSETKSLTVRLPADLYRASKRIAEKKRISFNALVQEGLTAAMQQDEYARLYEAFGELGEDREECDIEFAAQAQWEVVSRGDS